MLWTTRPLCDIEVAIGWLHQANHIEAEAPRETQSEPNMLPYVLCANCQNRSALLRDSLIAALYFWQSHFSLIALVRERTLP